MEIEEEGKRILWAIFQYIGARWKTSNYCTIIESGFSEFIKQRIEYSPSYSEFYSQTIDYYKCLLKCHDDDSQIALQNLFQNNQLPAPKYPDILNFVLKEFMIYNLANGGFKVFGYINYLGYMGGLYHQVPPPYRVIQ